MSSSKIYRYGLAFPVDHDDAQIECDMIRQGGQWTFPNSNKVVGNGLFYHYKRLFRLFWPEDDQHRWEDLELQTILDNQFTSLLGCSGSVKTTTSAKWALCFYACWPEGTTILISSTDMRGLELRVWGRVKELHERAKTRFWWMPGNVIDSKKCVATDDIDEKDVRDLRQGIICIPCLSSTGQFVGLGKYVGIHNSRVIFIGDEMQLMRESLLDAIPNLINNPYTKFIFLGNPLAQNDPLDRVSEPLGGWASIGVPKKTTSWKTRFMEGTCLCLPGLDSPNYDYPADKPDRFPYMVGRKKEKLVRETYGEDSQQYCSQILGVRISGLTARKVITREICDKFKAFDKAVWKEETTKIYSIDAAYGSIGGDRCVAGWVEFGTTVDGIMTLSVGQYKLVPVSAASVVPPDDQIAEWVKQECELSYIPPENVYFDGRTLLASAFSRIWSSKVNPVDFGGRTTTRPVMLGMNITDEDGSVRAKLCCEHYSKFVTELWFSLRYTIEGGQFRGMDEAILDDAMPREWKTVRGNMVEIESKTEMKKRTGKSPDLTDWLVTSIEGARRRGFQIKRFGSADKKKGPDWLDKQVKGYNTMMKDRLTLNVVGQ